ERRPSPVKTRQITDPSADCPLRFASRAFDRMESQLQPSARSSEKLQPFSSRPGERPPALSCLPGFAPTQASRFTMPKRAVLKIEDKELTYPVVIGSEGEKAIDFRTLRADSGYITYDEGYGSTGSCESEITFIDGEAGILRYRGYPL